VVRGQVSQHPVQPTMRTTDAEQPGFPWQQYAVPASCMIKPLPATYLLCRRLEGTTLPGWQLFGPDIQPAINCHVCLETAGQGAKKIATPG
jgi:hypothetical protein